MVAVDTYNYKAIRVNAARQNAPSLKVKKILLAEDDDDDFCLFNSAILSIDNTVDILRTKNGIMFFSLLETAISPDVIILDINMPYRNGISCLKEIKSRPNFKDARIIMFSTSRSDAETDLCYDLGANAYLIKPGSFSYMEQQFAELFSNPYFMRNEQLPRNKFVSGSNWFHYS